MNLPVEIPIHLHQRAISLDHLGVDEVAWTRDDVFEIIRALEQTRVAILGGDVLQKFGTHPTHNYDSWHTDRKEREAWLEYAARSRQATRAYVNAYPNPQAGSITFVLVFSSESD